MPRNVCARHGSNGLTVLHTLCAPQGMNFVAALLLLAAGREPERAFWLLSAVLERVCL